MDIKQTTSAQRLLFALKEARKKLESLEAEKHEPIAIIGLSCRFPGANNPDEFWELLQTGQEAIREVPGDRWDINTYYDPNPDQPGKMYTRFGGFLNSIDQFDPLFFGISPREASYIDPGHRLLLQVCWEALENAGQIQPRLAASPTGVFMGLTANDYAEYLRNLGELTRESIDTYDITGTPIYAAAGRISYALGLSGPSLVVNTACSSSLVSVHLACQSLRSRECEMALAGGVNMILSPESSIALCRARMLSPDGRCKTFDAAANGMARGEGCGVVVLKRLSDAIGSRDNILGVILGSATNQDGPSSGFTVPSGSAQQRLIRQALHQAQIQPCEVQYIEAHGTGTPLGDPIEVNALARVFQDGRSPESPLLLGSVKTNLGHLEAAAGIAGLIKVVLALQHETIPAHLHFKQPNPHIRWEQLNVKVTAEATPWLSGNTPRIAGVSSFGASGTNAHVIVADPASLDPVVAEVERGLHLLNLSAKTPTALQQLAERYLQHLDRDHQQPLADLCYTASTGRIHLEHRLSLLLASREDLRQKLSAFCRGEQMAGVWQGVVAEKVPGKLAFLFTGQGSQFVGMGQQLYQTQPTFRAAVNYCAKLFDPYLDVPLLEIIYPHLFDTTPPRSIHETVYAQPSLFTLEYALYQLWKSWGIEPLAVMGHSVGEYVAATVAGVFSLEDGVKLIATRAKLMQRTRPGKMVAVWASPEEIKERIFPYSSSVAIAGINGTANLVLSGESEMIDRLVAELQSEGIQTKFLSVSGAFHSPLMQPILTEFRQVAQEVSFFRPQIPLISNVTGLQIQDEIASANYWVDHIQNPILFAKSLETAKQSGYQYFLEIGPRPVLTTLGQLTSDENSYKWLASLNPSQSDWQQILETLAQFYLEGMPINWLGFDRDYSRFRVPLPSYPWQQQRCWVEGSPGLKSLKTEVLSSINSRQQAGHPLLGERIKSPSKTILFSSKVRQSFPAFLQEHRIFNQAVFPATAYLEMVLSAGDELFPQENLAVKDFSIRQALILPEETKVVLQLILNPIDNQSYNFEIYSQIEDREWQLHGSGCLQKTAKPKFIKKLESEPELSWEEKEFSLQEFYRLCRQQGIDLGVSFQSLRKVGFNQGIVWSKIELVEGLIVEAGEYKLHPVLLDACLQTLGLALSEDNQQQTYIQVGLEQFKFYGNPGVRLWSKVEIRPVTDVNLSIRQADFELFNSDGELVVQIEGLKLMRINRQSLLPKNQEVWQDWLYDLDWKPQLQFSHQYFPASYLLTPEGIREKLQPELPQYGENSDLERYQQALIHLEQLSIEYLLNALTKLGLKWELNRAFDPSEIFSELQIAKPHQRLLDRFLEMLSEVGILQRTKGGWKISRCPQLQDRQLLHQNGLAQHPIAEAEFALLSRCGEKLAEVLQGQCDPLQLLFPNGDLATASRLYQNSPGSKLMNTLVQKAIGSALSELPKSRGVRVLEVGAGTGGTTAYLLPILNPNQTQYVFTDVSPAFTKQAAQKFQEFDFVEYQVLDLEINPDSQGFIPHQYDLIVAANVLHATADLTKTIENLRQLLAPNGLLILIEGSIPMGWIDLTFGLTEGWWRFTDVEVRANYPLITGEKWIELLQKTGFSEVVNLVCDLGNPRLAVQSAVIVARGNTTPTKAIEPAPHWLIFADTTGIAAQLAAQFQRQGATAITVFPGSDFKQITLTEFVVNPTQREDLVRLIETIEGHYRTLQGVIHCWSLDTPDISTLETVDLEAPLQLSCGSTLYLVQSLIEVNFADPPCLWLVTRGSQGVKTDCSLPIQSPLWGLGKTIAIEHPEFRCRLVDLDPNGEVDEGQRLWAEIVSPPEENREHLGFRQGQRYGLRFKRRDIQPHEPLQWRADATYLITGGLGGIGLVVAQWMIEQGVRHLVLLSRRPPDRATQATLERLQQRGATVRIVQADVAIPEQLESVLNTIQESMPPLKGVIHSAGIFEDRLLRDHRWELFRNVFAPKISGGWNLHLLTRDLPLDFFVLFSSGSSMLGASGLGNYVAANAFLDGLAYYRQSQGLPGLSINWGAWNKVGMAEAVGVQRELQWEIGGMGLMEAEPALNALAYLLSADIPQMGVISLDWQKFLSQLPQGVDRQFFEDFIGSSDLSLPKLSPTKFQQQLEKIPLADRRTWLMAYVQEQVSHLMGLSSSQVLTPEQAFFDLGMDSLMSVELRNRLQKSLGCNLISTLTFQYPTLGSLVDYLADEVLQLESAKLIGVEDKINDSEPLPSCLVPLQPAGNQPPFFCVHPLAGVVFPYYELSGLLGFERPFYGIQSLGLDTDEEPLRTIEEMADHYVKALRVVQPNGPYYLGGWSFGAPVAFEMAQRLQQKGESVALLVLIDQPSPDLTQDSKFKLFTVFWSSVIPRIWPYVYDYFSQLNHSQPLVDLEEKSYPLNREKLSINYLLQLFDGMKRVLKLMKLRQPAVRRVLKVIEVNNKALLNYQPPLYSGKITLFRSREFYQNNAVDPTWGWGKLTSARVEIHPIPGNHLNLLRPPQVKILAEILKKCLNSEH